MSNRISIAKSAEDIQRCYDVMAELRPRLGRDQFLSRVRRQGEIADYELVFLTTLDGIVKAVGRYSH